MFLSWFDFAHHDPEQAVEGSGVQSGFRLDSLRHSTLAECGNDGLREDLESPLRSKLRGIRPAEIKIKLS